MYLEDYKIGQEFKIESAKVDEKEMVEFAKEYDPRPFHIEK